MKEFTMRASSNVAQLLIYMHMWGMTSISAKDACKVIGCRISQLTSVCTTMIRHGFVAFHWTDGGRQVKLHPALHVELQPEGVLKLTRATDVGFSDLIHRKQAVPQAEPDHTLDDDECFTRTWVSAAGLPPPYTTAARSVFDLAGRLDHV